MMTYGWRVFDTVMKRRGASVRVCLEVPMGSNQAVLIHINGVLAAFPMLPTHDRGEVLRVTYHTRYGSVS
jgi:hypothetical protein